MSDEIIKSKIELLEEQISNIERSGFYTEQQINKLTCPLVMELTTLRLSLTFSESAFSVKNFTTKMSEIVVNNPEIITE
ncbi:conserved hypothetical protein [Flavobacterium psychrophilum]|uniref:hypothetical protein n=1 Tax=Flavobacterium psychrophilum TaxID=96345 RepID=UPI000B7C0AF2|nr:hypothetical protein [Flavobacterium psychrophilum]SNB43044.1 conserved hypothetical protein [Flavobacterium psychrophilum]